MDYVEARQRLVDWLRLQMMGPAVEGDIIDENPLKRYHVGVLSPIEFTSSIRFEVPETSQPKGEEDAGDEGSYKRYYTAPSTVGFTFFVSQDAQLCISAKAAIYESLGDRHNRQKFKKQSYKRVELQDFEIEIDRLDNSRFSQKIWSDRAGIVLDQRRHGDGYLCTLALYNGQRGPETLRKADKVGAYLFERKFAMILEKSGFRGNFSQFCLSNFTYLPVLVSFLSYLPCFPLFITGLLSRTPL